MAGASVTEQINDFIRGIELRDVDLIKKTLDAKVSPDTPISGFHPLYYLLASAYRSEGPEVQNAVTEEQYAKNTSQIIDLLFDHGAKVAEPEKYISRGYKTLMDSLLLTNNFIDASTVLLHAILETASDKQPVYKPDVNAIITRVIKNQSRGEEEVDAPGTVSEILSSLERVHNIVRQRLEDPQTDIEKAVAEKYLAAAQHYTQPFARPSVKTVIEESFPDGLPTKKKKGDEDELSGEFDAKAMATKTPGGYLKILEKKDPAKVIAEMNDELVGFDKQKTEAQSLVFGRQFAAALGEAGAGAPKAFGEAQIGPEGIGKISLARKKAELLVSLGLAGPAYVEFTRENMAAPSENLPVQALAKLFGKADIINIEVPDPNYNLRNPTADFTLRMIIALKASLQGRGDKPIVFMSGSAETIKTIMEDNPGLEVVLPKYTRFGEMSTDTLLGVLDKKLSKIGGGEGFKINKDARDLVGKALEDIRKEFGKEFQNAEGILRVIDAIQGPMGKRLFGGDRKEPPTQTELRTVTADDIKALDMRALLAGPLLAKRQAAGFGAKLQYSA